MEAVAGFDETVVSCVLGDSNTNMVSTMSKQVFDQTFKPHQKLLSLPPSLPLSLSTFLPLSLSVPLSLPLCVSLSLSHSLTFFW